jgi:hypothetical protein
VFSNILIRGWETLLSLTLALGERSESEDPAETLETAGDNDYLCSSKIGNHSTREMLVSELRGDGEDVDV